MSLFKSKVTSSARKIKVMTGKAITGALFVGLGLALSGCQFGPLYSADLTTGQTLASALSAIEIDPAKDRVEQEVRNHLVFAFTGGGAPSTPAYRLVLNVTNNTGDLDIESGTGLAKTTRVRLTANYRLINLSDNEVVTTGSSFFTASFAKSTQRFANDRAEIDAQNRAAEQVANDIQLRLSAYFAAGT